MVEKLRVKNLSTRYLEVYRYGVAIVLLTLVVFLIVRIFLERNDRFFFIMPVFWSYLIYIWLKANMKVFRVEFDDDYLYVIRKKQDVVIPLENIKDIEMKNLAGVWRVDLAYADILGDHFYFKPSLLYPLNYRTKDALVNQLWDRIEEAKRRRTYFKSNALHS